MPPAHFAGAREGPQAGKGRALTTASSAACPAAASPGPCPAAPPGPARPCTPAEVAARLWALAGGPPAGWARRAAQFADIDADGDALWGDIALDAFETLIAALLDPAALAAAARAAGAPAYGACARELLVGAPQVYWAVARVRGLALALTARAAPGPDLEKASAAIAAHLAETPAELFVPSRPAGLQPGLPLIYGTLVLG